MSEQFFRQSSPFRFFERSVEAQQPTTALETVTRHLELVHRVDILDV